MKKLTACPAECPRGDDLTKLNARVQRIELLLAFIAGASGINLVLKAFGVAS